MIKKIALPVAMLFLFAACQNTITNDTMTTPTPNATDQSMDYNQDDTEAYETTDENLWDAPAGDNQDDVAVDGSSDENTEASDSDETVQSPDASGFSQTGAPQPGDTIATVTTNKGTFKIRLFADLAPKTVENFTTLAEKGYYKDVTFHRVISGFMIQGGDPTGTGAGGESAWGGKFDDEFSDKISNIKYSIAMANAGPNTNGSQFFINQVDNSFLDFDKAPLSSKHAVFGQVFEGQDVIDAIASSETGPGDKPVEEIKIEKIEISTL